MFKRMSQLERRAADGQEAFSRHWQHVHGPLIRVLPGIRRYVQNHIVRRYGDADPRLGGIVELQFDEEAAMERAFSAPQAAAVMADEPNFLGHASGYIIGDSRILFAPETSKLVLVARRADPDRLDAFVAALSALPGLDTLLRDDVRALMARPGMVPRPVSAFLHLYFPAAPVAEAAAGEIVSRGGSGVEFDLFGVRIVAIV